MVKLESMYMRHSSDMLSQSGGVRQGEKQTAHQYMVAGNDFDTVEGPNTE